MMRLAQREKGTALEPRYDGEKLRKVTALATQLQSRSQETLTAREMEAIGAEVGLDPAFIREALAHLSQDESHGGVAAARMIEFRSLVGSYGLALLWGLLAYLCAFSPAWMTFFTLVAPVPLALVIGFIAGRPGAGFGAAMMMVVATAPTMAHLVAGRVAGTESSPEGVGLFAAIWYGLYGTVIGGWLGQQGARIRNHYFPLPVLKGPVPRRTLMRLLFTLQRQLEGQQQRRAFLSVDVVGSSAMKQTADPLAAEYSFDQYRQWVEQIVRAHGGAMQSAAGDGVMALFALDAQALRAARRLQEEVSRFNQEHNRLPQPFRLRCGVNAGELAIDEGVPLGHLQSPVIDRAAALQKRAEPGAVVVSAGVAAAALVELGNLTPLPEPVAGEPAFAWRGETRAPIDSR